MKPVESILEKTTKIAGVAYTAGHIQKEELKFVNFFSQNALS